VKQTPEQHCVLHAMLAKEQVFKAQDAAERIADPERRKRARKWLLEIRSRLESLDNYLAPAVRSQPSPGGRA
jgi:hypothetical protein